MDKYADIKVDDVVYIEQVISYGWHKSRNFWIPRKVERVTPKQFQVYGKKYRKSDGRKVTSEYGAHFARWCGEIVSTWGTEKEIVSDQTVDRDEFIKKLKARDRIMNLTGSIRADIENDNIFEIMSLLEKAYELSDSNSQPLNDKQNKDA